MKTKKNKSLAAILLVFALVFVTGGVYAAASGVLTFEGVANLNSNVTDELKLEYQYGPYGKNSTNDINGSKGTMEISPDGQTITVNVDLKNPGDGADFWVYVANTGTVDAKLGSYTLTSPDYTTDELNQILFVMDQSNRVNGVPLNGQTIKAGETVDALYCVRWLYGDEAASHAGESISFSLSIDYQAA